MKDSDLIDVIHVESDQMINRERIRARNSNYNNFKLRGSITEKIDNQINQMIENKKFSNLWTSTI